MEKISSLINKRLKVGIEDSFHILSLKDVRVKCEKWMEAMPRVTPFYAVKCNDHEGVLRTLMEAGAGE